MRNTKYEVQKQGITPSVIRVPVQWFCGRAIPPIPFLSLFLSLRLACIHMVCVHCAAAIIEVAGPSQGKRTVYPDYCTYIQGAVCSPVLPWTVLYNII